jgi:putative hydrolase of the HAD superfamily
MKPAANILAVTFDVGGTLIKPWPSVGHVYAEVAARHGCSVSPTVLNQRFAQAWWRLKKFNHSREEWAALVDETFAGLSQSTPRETFFHELYNRFAEASAWRVFDDVRPTLDALAARDFNLGIISNWDERLRPLLDQLGLSKYFEAIVVSQEVGFPKPSPVIFEHASRLLGLAPESILHVGDSREHDAEGATAAGFQMRWLARERESAAPGQIASLLELTGL